MEKISEFKVTAGKYFGGPKVFDIFSMVCRYNKPVQYGRESAHKSGQLEAMLHLITACTENNTVIRET